jgi:hypothetical protein
LAKLGFSHQPCQLCQQLWARLLAKLGFPWSTRRLCQQLRPMLLAKKTVGKAGLLCQQPCPADLPTASTDAVGKPSCWQSCRSLCQPDFANSRRFPVGEGNVIRADGVPLRQRYTWLLTKLS